jgi:hypothetical protein
MHVCMHAIVDNSLYLGEQVPGSDDGSYSSRATLLQAMGKALEDGDMDSAVALRAEFARRTILRADPTQSKGSYDPYLDQVSSTTITTTVFITSITLQCLFPVVLLPSSTIL